MREIREKFADDDEPAFLVFALTSALRKYPYETLTFGVFAALTTNWASQLRPLFTFNDESPWQSWTLSFSAAGQSNFAFHAILILLASSGKLRTRVAQALRAAIGVSSSIWMAASLLIYRWANFSSFSSSLVVLGLLQGLLVASLHFLMFWWATDPRTLRPYASAPGSALE
jgi:hypothetical protein